MKNVKCIFKKFLGVILASIALFSCAACKNNNSSNNDSNEPVAMKYFIQNGASDYCVVISDDATDAEQFAAEELIAYTEKVSGVTMQLKTDAEVSYGKNLRAIVIGENKLLKRARIEINSSELNTDGFIIKNVDEMIFISGAYDRATLYGVYDFIERYYGVKFLTYDTTYIPQKQDVQVEEVLDVKEIPDFEVRSYYAGNVLRNPLFAAQSRLISPYSADISTYGGNMLSTWYENEFHNVMEYVKTSPVWEEHDEWFNEEKTAICYTNGLTDNDEFDNTMEHSVVKTIVEELKRRILESKPAQKFFMVGQEDVHSPCACIRCQASESRNGGKSGMQMAWINAIAKEVEAWASVAVPNKEYYICTFAYQWSQNAPVKTDETTHQLVPFNQTVIPHKDVYIFYAAMSLCYSHEIEDEACMTNAAGRAQLEGWSKLTDRFILWDYGCNYWNFYWWFPNLSVFQENLKTYQKYGMVMVMNQGIPHDDNSYEQQLKAYIFAKLSWNIEQNVYELVEEFNKYYFEEASEYMNAFVDLFERHYAMLNIHSDLYEHTKEFFSFENFPLELFQTAISYVEQGQALIEQSNRSEVEKENFRVRFQRAILLPKYMILKNIDNYGFSEKEKTAFINEFFKATDELGITNFGEGITANQLKEKYGY